jgi:hypothetical protein
MSEMVIVDSRPGIEGRPCFEVIPANEVLTGEFFEDVRNDFAELLRKDELPFLNLLGLPHEVEGLIRLHGLRSIMRHLDGPNADEIGGEVPNVALLVITGPFLTLDPATLQRSLTEMFSGQLAGEMLEQCVKIISELAERERSAGPGDGAPGELVSLISGDSSYYATLWQKSEAR